MTNKSFISPHGVKITLPTSGFPRRHKKFTEEETGEELNAIQMLIDFAILVNEDDDSVNYRMKKDYDYSEILDLLGDEGYETEYLKKGNDEFIVLKWR